jgi:hypothetical protein
MKIEYDSDKDQLTINGIRYACALFRYMGSALSVGRTITIKENTNGLITYFSHSEKFEEIAQKDMDE